MQCGVSCLAMICRYYGKNYSLEYLDKFCHANVSGVSMLGIADGAKNIGLNTMTVAASIDELGKIIETGNHVSLIEKKGAYYNLVKNQLELGN